MENHISYDEKNLDSLIQNKNIQTLYKKEINWYVNHTLKFKLYEHIKDFRLVESISTETGEMTATLKPKRKIIEQKYKSLVEELCAVCEK